MATTARETVLTALLQMEQDAYSNLTLDHTLDHAGLSLQDRMSASALFYGVLERKLTLDAGIRAYSSIPFRKLSADILWILRMGFYQILYLDSVPDSAAVNESVRLVYRVKKVSAKGFVNAVLRNFIRNGKNLPVPEKASALEQAEIQYSCPKWLIELWNQSYSGEITQKILEASLQAPPLYLRVNTAKITAEELRQKFIRRKREADLVPDTEGCLAVKGIGSIRHLEEYQKGLFHVQDLSSQLLCKLLDPRPGDRIFDLCAAPGGKSFTIAQRMENQGELLAFDLLEHRVELIRTGARRLGLSCVKARVGDASQWNPDLGVADKVLCDVPCSGLGIIRRKPEIKYKDPGEFENLPEIQRGILQNAARYVRPGGILLYSTCTLNPKENEEVVQWFLGEHPEFAPKSLAGYGSFEHTFFPEEKNSDGFYLAMLERKG